MFLPKRQLSCQKTYFFPSHFVSILSCSACLVGIMWDKNTVLYQENEPKYHFNNRRTVMASPKFQSRRLHFKLLGKTFSQEFIKTLFFTNSENKNHNFTVIFTIYFH